MANVTHIKRTRRGKRIAGAEVRGNGPKALLAALVLQAVSDLRTEGRLRQEAEEWLLSSSCRYCLHLLDVPYQPFIEAVRHRRLQQGTSTRAFWEDSLEPMLDRAA